MADGDPVCVFVGEWKCFKNGGWKFEYTAGRMAKTIIIKEDMSFKDLTEVIFKTFNIAGSESKIRLSFWSPEVSNTCTQARIPPVSLTSDNEFFHFKNNLAVCKNMSILMSTHDGEVGEVTMSEDPTAAKQFTPPSVLTSHRGDVQDLIQPEISMSRKQLTYSTASQLTPSSEPRYNVNCTMVQLLQSFETAQKINFCKEVAVTKDTMAVDLVCTEESAGAGLTTVGGDLVSTEEPPGKGSSTDGGDLVSTEQPRQEGLSSVAADLVCREQPLPQIFSSVPGVLDSGGIPPEGLCSDDDSESAFHELVRIIEADENNVLDIQLPPSERFVDSIVEDVDSPSETIPNIRPRTQSEPPNFLLGISEDEEDSNPVTNTGDDDFADENVENIRVFSFDMDDPVFNDLPPALDYLPRFEADDEWYVGRVFQDKGELKKCLAIYALERRFGYLVDKADRSRYVVMCVDRNCPWRIYAKGFIDSPILEVRTLVLTHTCCVVARSSYKKRASASVLGELINTRYAHGKSGPRACDLPDIILAEFNVNITYSKAWRAKECALQKARGNGEDNYKLLTTYLKLLVKSNPGTLSNLKSTVDQSGRSKFLYLFIALGASIAAVPFLRRVVVVDGTQLKGKYKGTLVTASCQDGNMHIFPLAFGVVDSENDNSWIWFMENLKRIIQDDDDLVFVSDRHGSISTAITKVFPNAHHNYCIVHIRRNVKHRFKNEGLADMVERAARAYTRSDFDYHWSLIEKKSSACAAYLQDIGFDHWSRYHCKGDRFNLMSSNISESLNNALNKAIDYPIITLIEFVQTMLMRWFYSRRLQATECVSHCTPAIEKILIDNLNLSSTMKVLPATDFIYQVNDASGRRFCVDLEYKSCTCLVFDRLKIPCAHAIAARQVKGIDIYSLVNSCYTSFFWEKIYEKTIMPVPSVEYETEVNEEETTVFPPNTRRPPGRPKRHRYLSQGEFCNYGPFKSPRCGRCFQQGHNRQTCKNAI